MYEGNQHKFLVGGHCDGIDNHCGSCQRVQKHVQSLAVIPEPCSTDNFCWDLTTQARVPLISAKCCGEAAHLCTPGHHSTQRVGSLLQSLRSFWGPHHQLQDPVRARLHCSILIVHTCKVLRHLIRLLFDDEGRAIRHHQDIKMVQALHLAQVCMQWRHKGGAFC